MVTMSNAVDFDFDYLTRLEDSARKLESTPQQRFEMMFTAQREVDTYLEQLSLDHPTGWVVPPKESQSGPDQVESGQDRLQPGPDRGQSGPDQVQSGPVQVQSGPDREQSGPDREQSGSDRVQSGSDRVQSGPDRVQSGPDRVQSGPDRVQSGPDRVQSGPDRVQSGSDRVQSGPNRVQSGPDRVQSGPDRVQSGPDRVQSGPDRVQSGPNRVQSGPDREQSGPDRVQSGSDRVQSGPDRVQSGPDRVQSGPNRVQSGPDRVQSGPDRVQSGPDRVQSGPNRVQSGPDRVQSGPDRVQSGPDRVQSGPDRVQSGPDRVQSGSDRVQSGPNRVQSGPDRVQSGPDRVQSGPDRVQSGPDRVQSGSDRVQSGPNRVQSGPDRVQSGPDRVQSGPDRVQSGSNRVQLGPNRVQLGPNRVQSGQEPHETEPLPIQEDGVSIDLVLRDFSRIGDEMERDGHPGHMAYVPGNSTAPAAIGDFLAASFNPYSLNVASCRRAVKMQQMIVQWVGRLFGYPDTCAGNLTSGGTVATMVAMATARDKKVPRSKDYSRSVLYVSELAHDGVTKCLSTLGMREAVVREVPVDDKYRMDVNMLRKFIENDVQKNLLPFLVVATTGTTDVGSMDPVPAIRAVATRYNMWLHVDACYGGFFVLCDSAKHLFGGVEAADSIAVDPHKGLYAPFGTGLVLVRNGTLLRNSNIRQHGNYMQDQLTNPEDWNPEDLTFEQSTHFRAPRVLLPLQLYGVSTFRDALQEKLELAKYLYLLLKVVKPVLSTVLFRIPGVSDNTNHTFLREITADGRFFITTTMVKGVLYLRVIIFYYRTHRQDLDVFIDKVKNTVVLKTLPEMEFCYAG
ncbi:HDC [Branchiostoma lanceolatum]|uniref:HDC protein n=1 Tax=Branchiostoma lanceolatum TaxID=7740 RepID=A0A8J9V5Y1_BRALA|nr:HDC [Branchiostoma lanceolatum]